MTDFKADFNRQFPLEKLAEDNRQLRAEIEHRKDGMDGLMSNNAELREDVAQLKSENEKLRADVIGGHIETEMIGRKYTVLLGEKLEQGDKLRDALLQVDQMRKALEFIASCDQDQGICECAEHAKVTLADKPIGQARKSGCYVNGIQVDHEWVKGEVYTKCRLCNIINMDV